MIGTGKIGALVARLLWHFRCETYAYDLYPDESLKKLGVKYADLETVLRKAEILSLNCPLTKETRHLIGKKTLPMMRDGVMIVNTGRGPLVDTAAVLEVRVSYIPTSPTCTSQAIPCDVICVPP